MPDEALITQIENLLAEIVELGGQNERSAIVPNLTVQDANPTNLTGFVIISDDRDGDNILAKKVGSVIYTDNDLVNVIFPKGGEAIAFQQGSQSANNGIWEIVASTITDIFYDKGDVGIGKSVAPNAALEILDTTQAQLRLTFEEDVKFTTFTVDTSHHLTIDPSSTGLIKLAADVTVTNLISHEGDLDTNIAFTDDDVEITVGSLSMLKLTETGQDLITLGPGSGDVDINFNGDMFLEGSSANFGINTNVPETTLHILSGGVAGTPATLARTVLLLQNSAAAGNFSSMAIIAGNTGASIIDFGDTDDNDVGGVQYTHDGDSMRFRTNTSERLRITGGGDLALGLTVPFGRLHMLDDISGFLLYEFDGLDATVRTVIPNGTGDVLYRLSASFVLRDSAGAVASGQTDISNGASVNLTVGGNTVRLRVNASGLTDIARTAGSDTIKVALTLRWL